MASVILTGDQIRKAITEYISRHELLPADGQTVTFRWGQHNGDVMVEVKEVNE